MAKYSESKIAVDTRIDESIPRVAVSAVTIPSETPKIPNFAKPVAVQPPVPFIKQGVNFFFDFLESIVVALSIFVIVYLFLVQPHEVKGSSMEPNFQNNELILTDKISYRFKDPQRGDVIIFKAPSKNPENPNPNDPEVDYIKRIIGLPGDKVKVEKGFVYVNDEKLGEVYLKDLTYLFPTSELKEGVDITVGPDEYFVLGDNRPHSSDSREFGPIPRSSIIGRAIMKYWPITKFGLIEKPIY